MKNLLIALVMISFIALFTGTSLPNKSPEPLASSIATVHVVERATRVIIRTTVEGEESITKNVDAGYVEDENMVNFRPVLEEISRLRSMGYVLQNSSVASISYGRGKTMRPYHSYTLVKP